MKNKTGWLTTKQLADLLGKSTKAITDGIRKGRISKVKITKGHRGGGGGKIWNIHISDPYIPLEIQDNYWTLQGKVNPTTKKFIRRTAKEIGWLSVRQLAFLLEISERGIRAAITSGRFTEIKRIPMVRGGGKDGKWMIHISDPTIPSEKKQKYWELIGQENPLGHEPIIIGIMNQLSQSNLKKVRIFKEGNKTEITLEVVTEEFKQSKGKE